MCAFWGKGGEGSRERCNERLKTCIIFLWALALLSDEAGEEMVVVVVVAIVVVRLHEDKSIRANKHTNKQQDDLFIYFYFIFIFTFLL